MRPSRAAILIPGFVPAELESLLADVLSARRYTAWDEPLPRGYAAYVGERLAFILTRSDDLGHGIIVPEDISHVFTTALWMAEEAPNLAFVAWRALQGMPPVMKFYALGRPQLKVGPDRDLEVMWNIPSTLPIDIVSPTEAGLPDSPDAIEKVGGSALAPYREQTSYVGPNDRSVAFLDRRSPLA